MCLYGSSSEKIRHEAAVSSCTVTGRQRTAIKQFKWRTCSSPAANPCVSFKRLCQKITDSDVSHRNFYPSCPISSCSLSTVLCCPCLPSSFLSRGGRSCSRCSRCAYGVNSPHDAIILCLASLCFPAPVAERKSPFSCSTASLNGHCSALHPDQEPAVAARCSAAPVECYHSVRGLIRSRQ